MKWMNKQKLVKSWNQWNHIIVLHIVIPWPHDFHDSIELNCWNVNVTNEIY